MPKVKETYRKSHLEKDVTENYDNFFIFRTDALIWSEFVKPFVQCKLEESRAKGNMNYLDFATGTGRLLKIGYRVFGEATGIDISQNMLKNAQQRVPGANLICADVTRAEILVKRKFDCATLFRFIRNAEPELRIEVLNWIHANMSPGGVLIVNNHGNSRSITGMITKLAFWLRKEARNTLTEKETIGILETTGFAVIECEGFNILPSVFGRPLLGRYLQLRAERLCKRVGLGMFGHELVLVAIRKAES